jgi:ABC-type branched-subunit amino acid transport system ATPase component
MGRGHVTGNLRLVLLVEQNFRCGQMMVDRHYSIEHRRVVDTAPSSELGGSMGRLHAYLGV